MAEPIAKKLFEEFPPVATDKWEEKIHQDLKGADYQKKLIWRSPEGISIKPYYRSEDLKELTYLESYPDRYPFVRGNKTGSNDWDIRQDIIVNHIEKANRDAIHALDNGVISIAFHISNGMIRNSEEFSKLLVNIPLQDIRINFRTDRDPLDLLDLLITETKRLGIPGEKITGTIEVDPIGDFTLTGRFDPSKANNLETIASLIKRAANQIPNYKVLALNGKNFRNAGSGIVHELGFTMAMVVEYLTLLTDLGLSADDIAPRIQLNLAIGPNYFMEIAKIRATRLLWAKIVGAYETKDPEALKIYIHSVTSDWNKTIYDPYVNLLRATTEAMASSLGGTDSLTVRPFDSIYKETSNFSERIARNLSTLIKEEAYFNKIIDPAAGSYYIENLTDSLIGEAWKLFLDIESHGGFIKAFREGYAQSKINETTRQRDQNIALGKEKFLGTNLFPNQNEKMAGNVDLPLPDQNDQIPRSRDVKPLKIYRASESFEQLRLRTEQHKGKQPVVYLFPLGDLTVRKARAGFSANFFACAGFKIIEGPGVLSVGEGIEECRKHKPDIVVVCSSDKEYKKHVHEVYKIMKDSSIVAVAGYPGDLVADLRKTGIRYFIHKDSNILESLQSFQKELGII